MDDKLSHLHNSTDELKSTFTYFFQDKIGDFMHGVARQFMAAYVTDHETRPKRLEKNAGIQ